MDYIFTIHTKNRNSKKKITKTNQFNTITKYNSTKKQPKTKIPD